VRFRSVRPGNGPATFAAQTRLVHEWRHLPFLDPSLPDRLLPPDWPGRHAQTLFPERHTAWGPRARAWFEDMEAAASE
jgi:phenylacetic acid degradation operon negative regulatory protein